MGGIDEGILQVAGESYVEMGEFLLEFGVGHATALYRHRILMTNLDMSVGHPMGSQSTMGRDGREGPSMCPRCGTGGMSQGIPRYHMGQWDISKS